MQINLSSQNFSVQRNFLNTNGRENKVFGSSFSTSCRKKILLCNQSYLESEDEDALFNAKLSRIFLDITEAVEDIRPLSFSPFLRLRAFFLVFLMGLLT